VAGRTRIKVSVARLARGEKPAELHLAYPREFFLPVKGMSFFQIYIPTADDEGDFNDLPDSYSRLSLQFDVRLADAWNGDGRHHLVSLRRPRSSEDDGVRFALFVRGLNARTILDLGGGDSVRWPGIWEPGGKYRVGFRSNEAEETLSLSVKRLDDRGGVIEREHVVKFSRRLETPLWLDWGMEREMEGGAFVPPIGWRFSNLRLALEP
jgi:hypothetical protein